MQARRNLTFEQISEALAALLKLRDD